MADHDAQMESFLEPKGYHQESADKITAAHGFKGYGKKVMERAAHEGMSAQAIKRRLKKNKLSMPGMGDE